MSSSAESDSPPPYADLADRYRRMSNLRQASMFLNWDQQVMMPEGGTPDRSEQLSAISATSPELLVDEEMADWLDAVESVALTDEQAANVREIRREHVRKADVDGDLIKETSRVASENQEIWQEAKADELTYHMHIILRCEIDQAFVAGDINVDWLVHDAEFGPIREWMAEHVHRYGQRYETPELIEVATGEPLTADYFSDYVHEKFTELYGL